MKKIVIFTTILAVIPSFVIYHFINFDIEGSRLIFLMNSFFFGIGSALLAIPIISIVFQYQYRKFFSNCVFRHRLEKYDTSMKFLKNFYELIDESANLDAKQSYRSPSRFKADMIIPLIRLNSNIDYINELSLVDIDDYQLFPNSLIRSKVSKEAYKKFIEKVEFKQRIKRPNKTFDHINQDVFEE